MKKYIIEILSVHPEGVLGSVIAALVSEEAGVDKNDVRELLTDMFRSGEIVAKPRVFRQGDPGDNDILFALPSDTVVKIAPDRNPHRS